MAGVANEQELRTRDELCHAFGMAFVDALFVDPGRDHEGNGYARLGVTGAVERVVNADTVDLDVASRLGCRRRLRWRQCAPAVARPAAANRRTTPRAERTCVARFMGFLLMERAVPPWDGPT